MLAVEGEKLLTRVFDLERLVIYLIDKDSALFHVKCEGDRHYVPNNCGIVG